MYRLFNGSDTDLHADSGDSADVDSKMISKTILQSNPNTHRIQYQILVNKVGAELSGTAKSVPITDTLPEGLQLISGSVTIRTVAIAPDGSYAPRSDEKEVAVKATRLDDTATNYNYQVRLKQGHTWCYDRKSEW